MAHNCTKRRINFIASSCFIHSLVLQNKIWISNIKKKNLWRRKCVRRAIPIEEGRSKGLLATWPLGHCASCKGSSYTKNEYNLFYQKLHAEYFLFKKFFAKSSIFWENCEKLFWGHIGQFFRERRSLAPKINITFFITNKLPNILLFSSFFQKRLYFLRK